TRVHLSRHPPVRGALEVPHSPWGRSRRAGSPNLCAAVTRPPRARRPRRAARSSRVTSPAEAAPPLRRPRGAVTRGTSTPLRAWLARSPLVTPVTDGRPRIRKPVIHEHSVPGGPRV